MKIDLHTHSMVSGHAYSTIAEMARSAATRGIEVMAITEHGPAQEDSPNISYFRNIHRMPKVIGGVRILRGIEVNMINSEGGVDMPDDVLKTLDVVILGAHLNCGYVDQGIEKNTEAVIKAMQNPYIKILAHPYAKYFDLDIDKIVQASIERDILIEFNVSYLEGPRLDDKKIFGNLKKTLLLLKEAGRKVILNSDAHNHQEVGEFTKALSMLDEFGLEESDILNSDVDATLVYLGVEK